MKPLILLSILLVLPFSAQAGWRYDNNIHLEAKSPAEIHDLLARYPAIGDYRSDQLSAITVDTADLTWTGPTTCHPGDARLHMKFFTNSVSLKGDAIHPPATVASAQGMPGEDPCAGDHPPSGRWVLEREEKEDYKTLPELQRFVEKNPKSFPMSKAEEFEWAKDDIQYLRWDGPTTCSPGDPRLSEVYNMTSAKFQNDPNPLESLPFRDHGVDPCAEPAAASGETAAGAE